MVVTIGGLPVYDAIIPDEESGMMRISLVDDPAVMSNFKAFDRDRKMLMYAVTDEERRLVHGVVMRADFPIFRRDNSLGEYYIIYKADTIRQMAEKYLVENRQNDVNLMHRENSDVEGVQMVQYYIKDTAKGISPAGFEDIADGSLFAEFHIVNDEVWKAVKEGTYRGFSLEGIFDLTPEQDVAKVETIVDELDGKFSKTDKGNNMKIKKLKAELARILAMFGNITTDKGILAWDGEDDLKEGDVVFIEDAEGNRTPAEDGDYTTADGKVIRVADGKVSEIVDREAEVAPQAEPVTEDAETIMGAVNTDKGVLSWNGDEDLKEGDEVFALDAENNIVPAPDGDYVTEDGKTISVVDGKVASIKDAEAEVAPEEDNTEEFKALIRRVADLMKENEALRSEIKRYQKMSVAKPAHEEVVTASQVAKTGNRGLDNLSRYLNALEGR